MIVTSVNLKWDKKKLGEIDQRMNEGLLSLGYAIANKARENAPVVTSALRNSIRVEPHKEEFTVDIIAGGIVANSSVGRRYVNYADKREAGPNRNPATEHYMENAQKFVMTGDYMKEYFGKVTQ